MENNMKCHCCGGNYKSIGNNSFKCVDCNHMYVNYEGDGLEYHKNEYRSKNFGTRVNGEINDGQFTEAFHKARKGICEKRIDKIRKIIGDDKTLLDIGAGGGTFVNMIKDKFSIVDCQEISDVCSSNLKKYGYNVYKGDFNTIDFKKTYDIVTCWHVLEHIKDVNLFVERVNKITDEFLVIEVPKCKREIPKNFESRGWDGHYHYFSENSLRKLFENSFEIIILDEGVQIPALFTIMRRKK